MMIMVNVAVFIPTNLRYREFSAIYLTVYFI